jgi:CPA1 family monovalent cation:H+ antiporter
MTTMELVRLLVILLLVALATALITGRTRVPYTIGLVLVGLVIAALRLLPSVHFTPELVLDVFVPALLFEGAWNFSVDELRRVWIPVALLVGPGLLLTLGVATLVLHLVAGLSWGAAILLGAILTPTDPVAVLALFRELGVGGRLRAIIEGESLLNDGVASVIYLVVLGLAETVAQGHGLTGLGVTGAFALGFAQLALGGVVLGLALGISMGWGLRWIDDPLVETTATLVATYGVYLLAERLGFSGIVAVVVLGLTLGVWGRRIGMSRRTIEAVDGFWGQIAFIANAVLFLLIGAQINVREFLGGPDTGALLAVAGWAIVAVLGGRAVAVYGLRPVAGWLRVAREPRRASPVLLWAGLRGALSLALVLALPLDFPERPLLVAGTYAVVLFTLLVQGLTLRVMLERLGLIGAAAPARPGPETDRSER